jgi:hypothetical protein
MADRILPKSLPRYILKKANSYLPATLKALGHECKNYDRRFTDTEVHGMLQDLLDSGSYRGWAAEFNIEVQHSQFVQEIETAKATLPELQIVKRRKGTKAVSDDD